MAKEQPPDQPVHNGHKLPSTRAIDEDFTKTVWDLWGDNGDLILDADQLRRHIFFTGDTVENFKTRPLYITHKGLEGFEFLDRL